MPKDEVRIVIYQDYKEVGSVGFSILVWLTSSPNTAHVGAVVRQTNDCRMVKVDQYASPEVPHHRAMRIARVAQRKAVRSFYRAMNKELNSRSQSKEGVAA